MASYCSKKKSPALLRRITSKHSGDYCLNCLYLFRTKNKLKSHKKECGNKYFCNVVMSSEDTKILQFGQYCKGDKASFIISADGCKNNLEKSSLTKVSKHILPGFLMSTISFKGIENNYEYQNCMKNICKSLREHTMKILNFKSS